MRQIRKLKVYSRTRRSEGSGFYSPSRYSDVPSIVLSGHWLNTAGFSIADHINVQVENGKLIITKEASK